MDFTEKYKIPLQIMVSKLPKKVKKCGNLCYHLLALLVKFMCAVWEQAPGMMYAVL